MYKKVILFIFILPVILCFVSKENGYEKQRKDMVEHQIKSRGVKDERVIGAMLKVPRHYFVPLDQRKNAYSDSPLPIGEGQTISQPYIVALMTELLKLKSSDKVLEVGTGSGYQAAILAEIVDEVYTIEIIPTLAKRADSTLKTLGYENIKVKSGDGYLGWEEYTPFDAIIITCAPPYIPKPLIDQLKQGGKIVVPLGEEWKAQILTLIEKVKGGLKITPIEYVRFVPMKGKIEEEK